MELLVRPARPQDTAAGLLYESARPYYDAYAGDEARARALLGALYPRRDHAASFEVCAVAEVAGAPVGVLAGFPVAEGDRLARRFVSLTFTLLPPWRWPTVLRHLRAAGAVAPRAPVGAWYVDALAVDPAWQRRGVGSALFDRLIDQLQAWHAELVRAEAAVSQPDAVRFLEHRGFSEWRRRWASFLEVASANLQPLLDAERQVTAASVAMTTYADEQARRGDRLARELYEAELRMAEDEPGTEPTTEPMSFERYVSAELETPAVLPQANFLALDGDRIVGVSRLERDLSEADLLQQAFTGTVPEYRGRRIAQALKLRTIQFARDHGYRRIRTNNDSANEAMLHINDRIGFKRETPVVILMRRF
jgi:GNAT superfamily N-acetyltransferase